MLLTKFTLYAPSGSKIFPPLFVKFRHHKDVRTICYWMIISGSKKRFFNSILPVLKSISFREMIAFFHSFVSVRYLTIFILFCFALFFHFPLRVNWFFLKKKKRRRGAGGCNLPIKSLSTLLLVVNRFWSKKMWIDKHLNSPSVFMSQGAKAVL